MRENSWTGRVVGVARVARFAFGIAAAGLVVSAQAAAPQVKAQAPGYYRMMLGEIEVTALSDGTVALPVDQLLIAPAAKVQRGLSQAYLKAPVETSVNAYLLNTGGKLVLVDAGAGTLFGPTLGKLLDNLKAAGYQPEQVDEIYITHLHPDHVGGLSSGDKRVFPNATVRADRRDAEFWLSPAQMDKAKDKSFFQGAMASLNPYVAAGKFQPFDGDTPLVPGVKARAARGHTPGHSVYVVESQGQTLVLWGDLIHVGAVQFAEPGIAIHFDTDNKAAVVARKKAFAEAAKTGEWIGAAHLAFPGLGHLRSAGAGYTWVPANYSAASGR